MAGQPTNVRITIEPRVMHYVRGKDVVQAGGVVIATCLSHEEAQRIVRALNTLESIEAHRNLIKVVTSLENANVQEQRQP